MKPGEQPHNAVGPVACGVTGPVLEGGGHVWSAPTETVIPGWLTVVVVVATEPGSVTVVRPPEID